VVEPEKIRPPHSLRGKSVQLWRKVGQIIDPTSADCVDPADRSHCNAGTSAAQNTSSGRLKHLSCRYFKLRCPRSKKNSAPTEENEKTEQKEEKFLLEPMKKIPPCRIRFSNR
jgi:hypothetical protein